MLKSCLLLHYHRTSQLISSLKNERDIARKELKTQLEISSDVRKGLSEAQAELHSKEVLMEQLGSEQRQRREQVKQ